MKTRKIRSLEVSEIGMGCMGFSHGYGNVPDEAYAVQAIQKAYEAGCTHFDTAEGYGKEMFFPGHNEQLVGKATEAFRKEVTLATKIHINFEEWQQKKDLCQLMKNHLEKSMQNLRTDYIDLYYLHRVNEQIPIEDVAGVMGRLRDEGLIREWGMSQVSVEVLGEANKVTPVGAVQNLYSMVERDCEKEIFPYCMENGISVIPFSPVASGFLSGKVTLETKFEGDDVRKFVPQLSRENLSANQPILDVIRQFSEQKNATAAQISLAWMLHKYPNVIPIPGAKKQEHILENLAACNVSLTDEEFGALETALDSCTVYGHRGYVETEQNNFGNHWKK